MLTYLRAAGASAISLTANHDRTAHLRVGADQAAGAVWWVPADQADEIARRARAAAGVRPDAATMTDALLQAAAELRVTLTPHATALARAGRESDDSIGSWRSSAAPGSCRPSIRATRRAGRTPSSRARIS
ncbi:hypothetical protein XH99_20525 [Bradyrhizobium nanningense]|uniref:Uncharacterized protein n=1 Tax=Bradyrhizobium nanningense TaxID=1325118 RepID=A0A4V1L1U5_9BRAD|nr:hypothetical protein XH99_20525 [Bradyrhizobium nanningense]RXH29558.1 hypothetical protein XH84_21335 [Bradyrhizobium nanningense]